MSKKLVIVAWDKVCHPYTQGDLGIESILVFNTNLNFKLFWDIINSKEHWLMLLKVRIMKKSMIISHHISSSILCSIIKDFSDLIYDSKVVICNVMGTNFWLDIWLRDPLINTVYQPQLVNTNLLVTSCIEYGT